MSKIELLLKILKEQGVDFNEEEYISASCSDDSKCRVGDNIYFIVDSDAIEEIKGELAAQSLDDIIDCVRSRYGINIRKFLDEDEFISEALVGLYDVVDYIESLTEGCSLFTEGYDYLIFQYPAND